MELWTIAVVSVLAVLFLMLKMKWQRLLYFEVVLDLLVTSMLLVMFQGTFAGMAAAVTGGALFSVVIYVMKRTLGYERPTWHGWVRVEPTWVRAVRHVQEARRNRHGDPHLSGRRARVPDERGRGLDFTSDGGSRILWSRADS